MIKKCLAVTLFLLSTVSVASAGSKGEGGVTFPLIADHTSADGTKYVSEFVVFKDVREQDHVYLRMEWRPLDGAPLSYDYLVNPIQGFGSGFRNALLLLRTWAKITDGKTVEGNIGSLRIVPIDPTGKVRHDVQLVGMSRLRIERPDGSRLSEQIEGIVDSKLPRYRDHVKAATFFAYSPHEGLSRTVWVSNMDMTNAQAITVAAGATYFGEGSLVNKHWTWQTTVNVEAGRTVAVQIPAVPDYVLNGWTPHGGKWQPTMGISAGCATACNSDYNAILTTTDWKSGDVVAQIDTSSQGGIVEHRR